MGVFSEEENPWNGSQFESDFQAWEYFIVGSGLPGHLPQYHNPDAGAPAESAGPAPDSPEANFPRKSWHLQDVVAVIIQTTPAAPPGMDSV